MIQTLLLHFIFLNFIHVIKSQTLSDNNTEQMPSQDSVTNFQPSLAVVIGMLAIMFSLTFILILYAKFFHHSSSVQNVTGRIQDGLLRARDQPKGVDKTVIESLPFFRFSSLKGSKQGLECAVCLAKFEDVEILRLLPKCKHAFHTGCIDQWLEKHSTCPLCRQKVSAEDISQVPYSNSLRWNQSDLREDSNLELYVQRQENRHGSSRFSIGSSFRKMNKKEDELPIQESASYDENGKVLHKLNHKIVVSDVMVKNRWSNVSSSDLMFLNSEMLNDISSSRFSNLDKRSEKKFEEISGKDEAMSVKERKREFESKIDRFPFPEVSRSYESNVLNPKEKRSMSEIVVHPRFRTRDDSDNVSEERRRRIWLPIARKTVRWFANRETRPLHTQEFNV